jgi:hypothetical protein
MINRDAYFGSRDNDISVPKARTTAPALRASFTSDDGSRAGVAEIKKNATAVWLSKTRVFERVCRTGKVTGRSGLNLS